jgi:hypothetical protein
MLSSGLLATTTGPSTLPFSMASRMSRRNSAFGFSGPWHFTHLASKIGQTFSVKNSGVSSAVAASAAKAFDPKAMPSVMTPTNTHRMAGLPVPFK